MPHPRYSGEEIARRGEALYEQVLRAQVETESNVGKIISIDIETGDYEIDSDPLVTGKAFARPEPRRGPLRQAHRL